MKKFALLNDVEAAAALGISRSMFRKQVSRGLAPKPLKIGRCSRWRAAELAAWIRAGCPPMNSWAWPWDEGGDHAAS